MFSLVQFDIIIFNFQGTIHSFYFFLYLCHTLHVVLVSTAKGAWLNFVYGIESYHCLLLFSLPLLLLLINDSIPIKNVSYPTIVTSFIYCSCKPSFRNIICKLNATTQVHCSSLIVVVKSIYTIYVISEDRYALTQLIIIVFFIYIGINWNNK